MRFLLKGQKLPRRRCISVDDSIEKKSGIFFADFESKTESTSKKLKIKKEHILFEKLKKEDRKKMEEL